MKTKLLNVILILGTLGLSSAAFADLQNTGWIREGNWGGTQTPPQYSAGEGGSETNPYYGEIDFERGGPDWRGGPDRRGPRRPPRYDGPRRPERPVWVDIHRFFSGQFHFFTLNIQEGFNARFNYEGVAFQALNRPYPGTVAVYRCRTYGGFFISHDPRCEGQFAEGLLGFIGERAQPGIERPLYRCVSRTHLITTSLQECRRAGFRVEAVLGFVP